MTKKIEAVIREEKLDEVKEALHRIGIVGMSVSEIRGHGREGGIVLSGRQGTYKIDLLPRLQISIVLSDHNVEPTVQAISDAARTGHVGDGLIFVYPVDDVIRIRTGERGREALTYEGDIDTLSAQRGVVNGKSTKAKAQPVLTRLLAAVGLSLLRA